MFRALCAHHQEVKLYYAASGIIKHVGGRLLHRLRKESPQPVHRTATYIFYDTRCSIIQFWPPDDEHIMLETCRGIKLTYYKTRICALSWLITKIILRCEVNKTPEFCNNLIVLNMFRPYGYYQAHQHKNMHREVQ